MEEIVGEGDLEHPFLWVKRPGEVGELRLGDGEEVLLPRRPHPKLQGFFDHIPFPKEEVAAAARLREGIPLPRHLKDRVLEKAGEEGFLKVAIQDERVCFPIRPRKVMEVVVGIDGVLDSAAEQDLGGSAQDEHVSPIAQDQVVPRGEVHGRFLGQDLGKPPQAVVTQEVLKLGRSGERKLHLGKPLHERGPEGPEVGPFELPLVGGGLPRPLRVFIGKDNLRLGSLPVEGDAFRDPLQASGQAAQRETLALVGEPCPKELLVVDAELPPAHIEIPKFPMPWVLVQLQHKVLEPWSQPIVEARFQVDKPQGRAGDVRP